MPISQNYFRCLVAIPVKPTKSLPLTSEEVEGGELKEQQEKEHPHATLTDVEKRMEHEAMMQESSPDVSGSDFVGFTGMATTQRK